MNIGILNNVYYKVVIIIHQYEYSTTLISSKSEFHTKKNCCLNKLFEFIIIFSLITRHIFMKTNINTHNDVRFMILKLRSRDEWFTTLI